MACESFTFTFEENAKIHKGELFTTEVGCGRQEIEVVHPISGEQGKLQGANSSFYFERQKWITWRPLMEIVEKWPLELSFLLK